MLTDALSRMRAYFSETRTAYVRLFRSADRNLGPVAEIVLADLARFCRAHQSTFHQDPHLASKLDGRREVWLRIQRYLEMTDEEIWAMHGAGPASRSDNE